MGEEHQSRKSAANCRNCAFPLSHRHPREFPRFLDVCHQRQRRLATIGASCFDGRATVAAPAQPTGRRIRMSANSLRLRRRSAGYLTTTLISSRPLRIRCTSAPCRLARTCAPTAAADSRRPCLPASIQSPDAASRGSGCRRPRRRPARQTRRNATPRSRQATLPDRRAEWNRKDSDSS